MKEKPQPRPERLKLPELTIDQSVIDSLKGKVELVRTIDYDKNAPTFGQETDVLIAREGAGLFGLTDWKDNKKWSGLINHTVLTARFATYVGQRMAQKGRKINPQALLNGMTASHNGRRQWDEAGRYKDAIPDAAEIKKVPNEKLGTKLVHGKIPQDAFNIVAALSGAVEEYYPDDPTYCKSIYDSLEYKVTIYIDHRTTQKIEPLHVRMSNFFIDNFYQGKEELLTPELRQKVHQTVKEIIDGQKKFHSVKEGVKALTSDEADELLKILGANEISIRHLLRTEFLQLIMQDADTEKELEMAGIDVDNINDQTVPMPKWENDFRKEYVESARDSILTRFTKIVESDDRRSVNEIIDQDFPLDTWWGQYTRNLWLEEINNN